QESITDATVQLDPVGRVVTGSPSGDYVFTGVRPDRYSVVVTAPSYQSETATVTVHTNENAVLSVQLQPDTKASEDCGSIFKRLDARIAETALPLSVQELPASTVAVNSRLAIRLSSDDGMDPSSVWAALTSGNGTVSGGVWRPATPGDNRDGWVVFTPPAPLAAGEAVTLTVGGVSAKGAILGPVSQDYVVTADKSSTGESMLPREDSSIAPIPAVAANAKSAVYRIGPAGVYDAPVTVRIPVAEDTDASAIDVFYYSESVQHAGWYRGGNVTGWLVPDSVKTVQVGGQTFVEIQVNHSGVMQVGQRMMFGAAVPFDMHATGSRAAWLALAGVSLVMGACLVRLLRRRARA
ncbi:MAG: carboxypeptidase-like regulatory domain-containing protein, partial [Candidatus Hydrogenedentes bacterium]|nr:carboxypeptidase-like regulatory domain-containing protein [Candidatus Hydrogenedentota bacterium]